MTKTDEWVNPKRIIILLFVIHVVAFTSLIVTAYPFIEKYFPLGRNPERTLQAQENCTCMDYPNKSMKSKVMENQS